MAEDRPTDVTPGTCAMRCAICSCVRALASFSLTSASGIVTRRVSTSSGLREAGLHLAHRLEGAHHQPRADQQDDRQGDLGDHERVARAVAFAAVARAAAAFLERGRQPRAREAQHGNEAEEDTREERDAQREGQHDGVDADLVEARQVLRPDCREQADAGRGEPEAAETAEEAEREALGQQFGGQPPPARAERRADGQLLLSPLGAHEEEVGDVGAGDEQHDADGAEEDPEHRADVADEVVGERPDERSHADLLEHLPREAGRQREALHRPSGIMRAMSRVGLRDRDAGLEAGDRLVAEVADEDLGAVEAERQEQRRLLVEEAEVGRQDADDLVRLALDRQTSDRRRPRLPPNRCCQ